MLSPFHAGFANELIKQASCRSSLAGVIKLANPQADLTHYDRRAKKLEPRLAATPAPPSGSMQGGALKNMKPPPAAKPRGTADMQRATANFDGPDVSPPSPKPVARPPVAASKTRPAGA